MTLHVLGTSHRTATAETRAAAALAPGAVRELLAAARGADLELVVLATCGRTEAYLSGDDAVSRFAALLGGVCPAGPDLTRAPGWYSLAGDAALEHLLRVACGLDSPLLGDAQVLGQLRGAVAMAQASGTLGRTLSPLLAAALRTGRQARTRTAIGEGAPGIGPAAAEAVVSRGAGSDVLVLGSGEAARLALRALRAAGCDRLSVSARTPESARRLAAETGARLVAWEGRDGLVAEGGLVTCTAVVVATGAAHVVLRSLPVRSAPLLVVDAGFPAQVAPDLRGPGVEVVSLEALTTAADAAAARRRAAVPAVERLVSEQLEAWSLQREAAPLEHALRTLHERAASAARRSAAALAGAAGLDPVEVEALIVRELRAALHEPVTLLRDLHPRAAVHDRARAT
jgi:glutamyl-tRNA reductase